jgi:TolB-like protein
MPAQRFLFGPFVLDCSRGMLSQGGSPMSVGNRALALLQALVAARGQVVTRSALMEAAWPGSIVEESNLTVQIAQLRKHLGEGDEWIATVPRIGYRFLGEVQPQYEVAVAAARSDSGDGGKISIAVLPFTNMSSDQEQEYLADGIAEDLIADLSKVPGLLVIARSSSFIYKGRPVDVRTVGRELGVRYLVEGSVRRAAKRVRISAQLIDASDSSHVWGDRFDRDLEDIFALQDEVVGRIAHALAPVLPSGKVASSRRATSLEAYDLFIRARLLVTDSPAATRAALPLLEKAIAIDPTFADAHAWLAMSHLVSWAHWGETTEGHQSLAGETAERAVALDPRNPLAHALLAYVRMFDGAAEQAEAEFATALRIDPNHADAWTFFAEHKVVEGDALGGIDCVRTAFLLNPYPPGWYLWMLGHAQYAAHLHEECVETLMHETTRQTGSQRTLAAGLAQLGRIGEAKAEAAQFLGRNPHFSIARWSSAQPFRNADDKLHFIEGYIKAGLPR